MSEFDRILMQNANMTFLYIKLYEQIKKYLEEVLEVSYGKRKETR